MTDPLSGHTAAQNTLGADGLRDGDALSSPTMTNLLQGVHGNGILRLEDTVLGSTRNAVNSQPGAVSRASAYTLTIQGGYVVLDGQIYEFANGPGNTVTMTIGNSSHGSGTALAASGEQSLYTIYVGSQGGQSRTYHAGGAAVATGQGLYPSLPSQYLVDYDTGTSQVNAQVVVLATVRCEYKSSGGGNHKVDVIEINDKRTFIRNNPLYMTPLTSGALTTDDGGVTSQVRRNATDGVQSAADLRALMASSETGDIGTVTASGSATLLDVSALWSSTGKSGTSLGFGPGDGLDRAGNRMGDELFYAGQENSATGTVSRRLFGMGVSAPSSAISSDASYTITSYGDAFYMLSPNAGVTVTLNPEKSGSNYLFPEGHIVEVCNDGDGTIEFDDYGTASATITVDNTGAPPPGVQYIGQGDTIQLISTAGTTVTLTMGGQADSTTSATTSGTTLDAKTLASGSYATSALHATAQAVEIATAINHHTEFTATNSSNVITVTQVNPGSSGNTTITITEIGATGFSKTNFTGGGGMGELVTAGKRATFIYEGSVWVRCDYQAAISALMTSFQLEDGDGTEVTINDGKEVKFVEGGGVDINWTDTSDGSDSDPYDMTFTLDVHGLTEEAIASGDYIAFSDEGTTDDPTRRESIDDIATLFAGAGLTASSAVMAVGAGNLIDVQANQVDVDLSEAAAAVMAEADEFVFLDNDDSSAAKRESLSDLLDTIAGTVGTTGLDRSGATLVVSDLHPVGVSGAANQLLTDDGDGTVTSEANLTFDGSNLHVTTSVSNSASVIFENTHTDTNAGPILQLFRNPSDDAVTSGDLIGRVEFKGHFFDGADYDQTKIWAAINAEIEHYQGDGSVRFDVLRNGTETTYLKVNGNTQDIIFNEGATSDFDFRVEGNSDPNLLFTDGTADAVGIGTDAPNQKLTVEGTISLKEQADANADTAAYGQIWVNTATPNELYFTTDAGDDIQLTSGTSIAGGGGASALNDLSDVSYSSGDLTISSLDTVTFANGGDAALKVAATSSGTDGRDLTIEAGSAPTGSANQSGGDLILKAGGGDGTGTSIMTFNTKVSGTDAVAERMRIHTNGFVGIAENAPDAPLHVKYSSTSDADPALILESTATSGVNSPDIKLYRNSSSPADNDYLGNLIFTGNNLHASDGSVVDTDIEYARIESRIYDVTDGTEDGALIFSTKVAGSNSSTMYIKDGRVGIGTEVPDGELHISGAGHQLLTIEREANNNGYGTGIHFQLGDSASSTAGHDYAAIYGGIEDNTNGSEDGQLVFQTSTNGTNTTKMFINSVGNVGIGTDAPNQPLTIEGTMSMKEQANANADVAAYGQLWIKSDTPNGLMFTDDAGNDVAIAAGAKLMSGTGLYTDSSSGGYWTGPGVPTTVDDAINRIAAVVVAQHGQIG